VHGVADEPAIQARALSARYGAHVALRDVSFALEPGQLVALVGPNGAGKSTLLRCLLGVQRCEGAIVLHGRAAFVPQRADVDLDFPLTVEQLVRSGRRILRRAWRHAGAADRQATARALARVGLDGLERRTLRELSGGQAQRALLARALVSDAHVLLLDEPLAGVDVSVCEALCELFAALAAGGTTLLLATHDLELVRRRFERCLALNRTLVADGAPADALAPHGLERLFVAAA
jgi:ABC-type Mn2+/Zn2+ transport system ATPase subunit